MVFSSQLCILALIALTAKIGQARHLLASTGISNQSQRSLRSVKNPESRDYGGLVAGTDNVDRDYFTEGIFEDRDYGLIDENFKDRDYFAEDTENRDELDNDSNDRNYFNKGSRDRDYLAIE